MSGKAKITIEQEGKPTYVVEMEELTECSIKDDVATVERSWGQLDRELRNTTITLKGLWRKIAESHQHIWKQDGREATSVEAGIEHFGLTCECGAMACGNLAAGIVHNVRELPEAQL